MAKGGIGDLYVKVGKELHSKKTLDNVPVRWRSQVDHPETQLAYITDEEAALLKKLDIHNSGVRYKHHIGPLGIPSYNGAGSGDSAGGGGDTSGGDSTGGSPAGDASGGFGGGVGDSGGTTGGSPAGDASGGFGGGVGDSGSVGDTGGTTGGSPAGDASGGFGGGIGDSGLGGFGGTGSSIADAAAGVDSAMGPTGAGAFGLGGVTGVDSTTTAASMAAQGISPSTDVSTSLSTMGLGDVSMGGFGPGGITGTGEIGGVSGLGMGAGNVAGGLGGLGGLGALGNTGPAGFAATESGFSTTGATSTPFGGASLSSTAQGYASPSAGMGFGVGPSGISMGAPFSGADVDTGMLASGGVPGTRGNAMAEQAAQMAAQVAANPTFSAAPEMTNAEIAAALMSGGLTNVSTSSLAMAASTPAATVATEAAPSVSPAPSVSTSVSTSVSPSVSPSVSTSVSPSVSPSVAPTAAAPSTATRSASSISAEDVAQPGWGHSAATLATNAALGIVGGLPGLAAQPAAIGSGSEGGGYVGSGIASLAEVPATTGVVIQPAEVQRQPTNPYGFNVSNFVTRYDPRNYSDYLPVQGYRA